MDDFGSGYSSLNMLEDVPIDVLKIDREFMKETTNSYRQKAIFVAIMQMANSLNIQVVVEGVENLENVALIGVGSAVRWGYEKEHMEERAKELGVNIDVRLNTTDKPKTQIEECIEMIDSGIDVLILTPRDVNNVKEILDYAKQKKVPVINYARVVLGQKVDLFVGYDSGQIGRKIGQYLSEMVYQGDYIILSGDSGDNNAALLYDGAMQYINPIKDDINILLDSPVAGWSPGESKKW